jgi:hypothetical protein
MKVYKRMGFLYSYIYQKSKMCYPKDENIAETPPIASKKIASIVC